MTRKTDEPFTQRREKMRQTLVDKLLSVLVKTTPLSVKAAAPTQVLTIIRSALIFLKFNLSKEQISLDLNQQSLERHYQEHLSQLENIMNGYESSSSTIASALITDAMQEYSNCFKELVEFIQQHLDSFDNKKEKFWRVLHEFIQKPDNMQKLKELQIEVATTIYVRLSFFMPPPRTQQAYSILQILYPSKALPPQFLQDALRLSHQFIMISLNLLANVECLSETDCYVLISHACILKFDLQDSTLSDPFLYLPIVANNNQNGLQSIIVKLQEAVEKIKLVKTTTKEHECVRDSCLYKLIKTLRIYLLNIARYLSQQQRINFNEQEECFQTILSPSAEDEAIIAAINQLSIQFETNTYPISRFNWFSSTPYLTLEEKMVHALNHLYRDPHIQKVIDSESQRDTATASAVSEAFHPIPQRGGTDNQDVKVLLTQGTEYSGNSHHLEADESARSPELQLSTEFSAQEVSMAAAKP